MLSSSNPGGSIAWCRCARAGAAAAAAALRRCATADGRFAGTRVAISSLKFLCNEKRVQPARMALPSEVPPAQWTAEQVQLFLREQGLGDNLLAQFASISGKGEA